MLGLALLLLVGLIVSRPLLQPPAADAETMTEVEALIARKEAIREQIRSLDFDRDTDKLPEEEYQRQREVLLEEGAAVLKRLDALGAGPSVVAPVTNGHDLENEIEAAIAQRREKEPLREQPLAVADDIEAAVARMRQARPIATDTAAAPVATATRAREGARDKFCGQCGRPRDPSDKFCAQCGNRFV
jgi:hypothetical protein